MTCQQCCESNNAVISHHGYDEATLIRAAQNGHEHCVTYLLEAGADVNIQDNDGMTPLMFAVNVDISFVRILIESEADINVKDNEGKTPLIHSISLHNGSDIAELLISCGADLNVQDSDGMTPLMLAVKTDIGLVQSLIENGADVNIKDNNGQTALMHSAMLGYASDISYLLVNSGADVNAQDVEGMTAIMYAALYGSKVNLFVTNETNLELRDNQGKTVLNHVMVDCSSLPDLLSHIEPVLDRSDCYLVGDICRELRSRIRDVKQVCPLLYVYSEVILKQKRNFMRFTVSNGVVEDNFSIYDVNKAESALMSSLREGDLHTALYLITTCYISEKDLKEMRQIHLKPQMSDKAKIFVSEAMRNPWPLGKLALIAVSSTLGSNPRRQEAIEEIRLPQPLKDMLMFQIPIARLSVHHWKEIPKCFDQAEYLQPLLYAWPMGRIPNLGHCDCDECRGKGYKLNQKSSGGILNWSLTSHSG